MWTEDRAAALVMGRPTRSLAGPAGAFLAIRLGSPAGHLAARLRVVRADPSRGEVGGHRLVEHGFVDGRGEQGLAELHAANGCTGSVIHGRLRHQTFLTRMSEPRAP